MNSKTNQLKMFDILPTKLCTHKEDVESINSKELDKIQEESYKFNSIDQGDAKFLNKKRTFRFNFLSDATMNLRAQR